MKLSDDIIKHYLKNVYFINGTPYAGKSTTCKLLAEKYDMHLCEENYRYGDFLSMTTPQSHPNMNYFKTMDSWEEFVTRDKITYSNWLKGVNEELIDFEILELISIAKDKKVIVDTNLPHSILKRISDPSRVAYMVTTPEISANAFFEREDEEKQFLLSVIEKTDNPEKTLKEYRETIRYCNREQVVNSFKESGFFCLMRETLDDDINEKLHKIEVHFGLKKEHNRS